MSRMISERSAHNEIFLPTPTDWKGQLSKDALKLRIERRFPAQIGKLKEHELDAFGLAVWKITGRI